VTRVLDLAHPVDIVGARTVREAQTALGPAPTVADLSEYVQAAYVLVGTVARAGEEVRFEGLELLDASGDLLRALEPVVGPADSVEAVYSRLADQVAAAATVFFDPGRPGWVTNEMVPTSVEAANLYFDAWEVFCEGEWERSIELADRALALEPDYIPALKLKHYAYGNSGGVPDGVESPIVRLRLLRDRMTRAERAELDYFEGFVNEDLALLTRATDELFRLDPKSFAYQAGQVSLSNWRWQEALDRLLTYDTEAPCQRNWSNWWWLAIGTYHALDRLEESLATVRDALKRFPQYNEQLRRREVLTLAALGRLDAADSALSAMVGGTFRWAELMMEEIGLELLAHGYPERARAAAERALTWYEGRDSLRGWRRAYHGWTLMDAGRLTDADTLFAALPQDAPDGPPPPILASGSRGVVLARMGRDEEAIALSEQIAASEGPPNRPGQIPLLRAEIAAELGDRDGAVRVMQREVGCHRPVESPTPGACARPPSNFRWQHPPTSSDCGGHDPEHGDAG
jgi:tetratricopeptide (TPR) repeat protein